MAGAVSIRQRDAQVIRVRYGIGGSRRTLKEVGIQLGVTRERVRQIQCRAENRLRNILDFEGAPAPASNWELPKKGYGWILPRRLSNK